MSDFDIRWLDLREPADRAARDPGLLAGAVSWLQASPLALIVDLGCGSGSTYRALTPALPGRPAWRLIDNDPALLAEARGRAHPQANVETSQADLAQIGAAALEDAGLVACSALLDLVSAPWMQDLAEILPRARTAFYAALTYDGIMSWSRPHPLDDLVTEAFNAHQRTDKGFGPALGPDATRVAAACLASQGFTVQTAASPWRLGPDQAALEAELVSGVAQAAAASLDAARVDEWLAYRQAWAGRSSCLIGHLDLLALPPGA